MDESSSRMIIDDDGDIDLIVGVGAEQKRLRVSSKVLILASKVFRVMLSDKFKEGNDLRMNHSSIPIEFPLPDDNACAMTRLCLVWHFKNERGQSLLGVKDLRATAVLVDKYDCVSSILFTGELWIQQLLRGNNHTLKELHTIAESALLLQSTTGFKDATKNLLLNGTEEQLRQLSKNSIIPVAAFDSLLALRSSLAIDMMEDVLEPFDGEMYPNPLLYGCPDKPHGSRNEYSDYVPGQHDWNLLASYQLNLRERGLAGVEWFSHTLEDLFPRVDNLSISNLHCSTDRPVRPCLACGVNLGPLLKELKAKYETRVSGLSLTSAKRGEGKVL